MSIEETVKKELQKRSHVRVPARVKSVEGVKFKMDIDGEVIEVRGEYAVLNLDINYYKPLTYKSSDLRKVE